MAETVKTKTDLVKLTIDGNEIEVPRGTLVIEAARTAGIEIPFFCYHQKLASDGNCRMCLVKIEKMPKLQVSCSVTVSEGMVVSTNEPVVEEARKGVLDFLLANHPLDCPICDEGGRCPLQNYSHRYTAYGKFNETKRVYEKDYFSPLIEKEMNRCIQCMRCVRYCDEVIDAKALAPFNRGHETEIGHYAGKQLDCEFCGGCVQICPVGAVLSRPALYDFRPWMLKRTETTCAYCADGCMIRLETRDETRKVIEVTSFWGNEPKSLWGKGRNEGDLCAKGYFGYSFVNSEKRLTKPLIKKDGKLSETSWEEAIDYVAEKLGEIRDRDGGKAVAGVASARCTNENLFLFQKLLREVIGTPNIDSTPRYGMVHAARVLTEMTGTARWLTSYEDILGADLILLIGADLTHTNPIAALKVKSAAKRGAKLIAATPIQRRISTISNIVNLATRHLPHHPGSERAVAAGFMKALIEAGGAAPEFQKQSGMKALKETLGGFSAKDFEAASGVAYSEVKASAADWSEARRAVILVGESVLRARDGYETMRILGDLAAVSGKLSAEGSGLAPLYEENNELGAWEMGLLPDRLPGGRVLEGEKGLSMMEILQGAQEGRIKGLYFLGENPVGTLPAGAGAAEAVGKAEFSVCQDLFLTETARLCDVVLPAASFAEQNGTFTNQEGFVLNVKKAFDPVSNSRADWEILSGLAEAMGRPMDLDDAEDVSREIETLWPEWKNRPTRDQAASAIGAYLSEGLSRGLSERYHFSKTGSGKVKDGEFHLAVGPTLFHSGKMSLESQGLRLAEDEGALMMNPGDGERIGVETGGRVKIQSPEGQAEVPVRFDSRFPEGMVFFPESFNHLKDLLNLEVCGVEKVPVFKTRKVSIQKA
ncbi:MAG TPA: NADH-quinone oxidoreductase subunit NuoG [Nitrospiria bacterium]